LNERIVREVFAVRSDSLWPCFGGLRYLDAALLKTGAHYT